MQYDLLGSPRDLDLRPKFDLCLFIGVLRRVKFDLDFSRSCSIPMVRLVSLTRQTRWCQKNCSILILKYIVKKLLMENDLPGNGLYF